MSSAGGGPGNMAQMGNPKDVAWGFLTKQGAVRKSWKTRWMVLKDNGCLYYFKSNKSNETPLGVINIKRDCTDVLNGDECSCSWPDRVPTKAGFGIVTSERTYFMYSANQEYTTIWITKSKEHSDQITKRTVERQKSRKKTDNVPQIDAGRLSMRLPSTTESILYETVAREQVQGLVYEDVATVLVVAPDQQAPPALPSKPSAATSPTSEPEQPAGDLYDDITDVAKALNEQDLYEDVEMDKRPVRHADSASLSQPTGVQKGKLSRVSIVLDSGSEDEDIYAAIAEAGDVPPLPPRQYSQADEGNDASEAGAMYDDIEELQKEVLGNNANSAEPSVADAVVQDIYENIAAVDVKAEPQSEDAPAPVVTEQDIYEEVPVAVSDDVDTVPPVAATATAAVVENTAGIAGHEVNDAAPAELYDSVDAAEQVQPASPEVEPTVDDRHDDAAHATEEDIIQEDVYDAVETSLPSQQEARPEEVQCEDEFYDAAPGAQEDAVQEEFYDAVDSVVPSQQDAEPEPVPAQAEEPDTSQPRPEPKPKPAAKPEKPPKATKPTVRPKPAQKQPVRTDRQSSNSSAVDEEDDRKANGAAVTRNTEGAVAKNVDDQAAAKPKLDPEEQERQRREARERRLEEFRQEEERRRKEQDEKDRIRRQEIKERERKMRQQMEEEAKRLELEALELEEEEEAEHLEADAEAEEWEEEERKRQEKMLSFLERDREKRERVAAEKARKEKEGAERLRSEEEWLRHRQAP